MDHTSSSKAVNAFLSPLHSHAQTHSWWKKWITSNNNKNTWLHFLTCIFSLLIRKQLSQTIVTKSHRPCGFLWQCWNAMLCHVFIEKKSKLVSCWRRCKWIRRCPEDKRDETRTCSALDEWNSRFEKHKRTDLDPSCVAHRLRCNVGLTRLSSDHGHAKNLLEGISNCLYIYLFIWSHHNVNIPTRLWTAGLQQQLVIFLLWANAADKNVWLTNVRCHARIQGGDHGLHRVFGFVQNCLHYRITSYSLGTQMRNRTNLLTTLVWMWMFISHT